MQRYDVVLKTIMSYCRKSVLEFFLNLNVENSEILEFYQETTSIRRADVPLLIATKGKERFIVLMELQTKWEKDVPLRLLEYDVHLRLKTGLEVLPVVMVLTKSPSVVESFMSDTINYRFRVIKLWEVKAEELIETGNDCLLPFIGVTDGGLALTSKAEEIIISSERSSREKADLLTSMALLTGVVSKESVAELLMRRRDIMIESYAYELIEKEGIKKGMLEGMLEDAREMVLEGLAERFKVVPKDLEDGIRALESRVQLKELHRATYKVKNLEEFRKILRAALGGSQRS